MEKKMGREWLVLGWRRSLLRCLIESFIQGSRVEGVGFSHFPAPLPNCSRVLWFKVQRSGSTPNVDLLYAVLLYPKLQTLTYRSVRDLCKRWGFAKGRVHAKPAAACQAPP